MKRKIRNKKGLSLIQLIITLSIIMMISISVFALYNKISEKIKIEQTTSFLNVSSVILKSKNIDYKDLNEKELVAYSILDEENQRNKFGGEIIFSGNKSKFGFTLTKVNQSACVEILNNIKMNYNIVNDDVLSSYSNLNSLIKNCSSDNLYVAYDYNINFQTLDLENSKIGGMNVELFPEGSHSGNNFIASGLDGGMINIKSGNNNGNMSSYLSDQMSLQEDKNFNHVESTGYENVKCGRYTSGNTSCSDGNMEDVFNNLLNAPEEAWDGADVVINKKGVNDSEMSDEDLSKICAKFTCQSLDEKGERIKITPKK